MDTISSGQMSTAYSKTFSHIANCPLPPELLDSLRVNDPYPAYDKEKAETWAVGILILSMMVVQADYYFYDWDSKEVEGRVLGYFIEDISKSDAYSLELSELVKGCLRFDPHRRIGMGDIKRALEKRRYQN